MMNEFKVGLFAVLAIIAVVYMSIRVTMNQSGFGEYQTYRTIVDDASGIFAKTPIKVAGISAGRIKAIELQGNRALVTFEVLRKIKITRDSILRIRSVGLLGDKFLEITIGDADELLAEDALVPSETGGGIENLARDVAEVVNDVKKIVTEFKSVLVPINQESPIKRIVRNVETMANDAREAVAMFKRLL
ncbi:MAG: MCE family protein, partial [Bacteriovoracaceae bacterium]|nr:MCE family protein [Bacteriovoracaceae bacterium]